VSYRTIKHDEVSKGCCLAGSFQVLLSETTIWTWHYEPLKMVAWLGLSQFLFIASGTLHFPSEPYEILYPKLIKVPALKTILGSTARWSQEHCCAAEWCVLLHCTYQFRQLVVQSRIAVQGGSGETLDKEFREPRQLYKALLERHKSQTVSTPTKNPRGTF
jgi:hypothetical protein